MCPPMRLRVLLTLLAAFVAFFGASAIAERVAHAGTLQAAPGHEGAPLCDARAASAYAAEPAPQPVDGGDVTQSPDSGCKSQVSVDDATPTHGDDLQRSPDAPTDHAALAVATLSVHDVVLAGPAPHVTVDDAPADEHRLTDNPPPRPIPWRH